MLYVDLNPVRARIVIDATDYAWSSANTHVAVSDSGALVAAWEWSELDSSADWRQRLELASDGRRSGRDLRRALRAGTPYGSKAFINQLEAEHGRSLRVSKPGPKPRRSSLSAVAS